MRSFLFPASLAAMLAVSCAPSLQRIGYREAAPPDAGLGIRLMRNAPVPDSIPRLATLIVYDGGFSLAGSEEKVIGLVRLEGATIGARCANLYNISPPSIWSACFQTYADFYADTVSREVALAATLPYGFRIDSTVNRGISLALTLPGGWVTGGNQKETGLQPSPDNIMKFGFGLRGTYMFSELLGAEAEGVVFYTSANKRDYQTLDLFTERLLKLGVDWRPFRNYSPYRLEQLSIRGGINYDWLELAREFSDLLTAVSGGRFVPYGGYAGGMGWYAGASGQFVFKSNMTAGIGLDYLYVRPKYPQASVAIDASAVLFGITFGYAFK